MDEDSLGDAEGASLGLSGFSGAVAHSHIVPDIDRVIIHFDVDCFYAQVEELRNPKLKGKPLGVTQKYIIVTSNYAARARGVTKLMGIKDAQAACPEINLVSGEDLTPYRQASKAIWSLLQKFGPVQRGGMDEAFVDVTAEVNKRIAANSADPRSHFPWRGHVWAGDETIVQDSKYRPQDLRVLNPAAQQASSTTVAIEASGRFQEEDDSDDDGALLDLVLHTERVIASQGSPTTAQHNPGDFAGNTVSCKTTHSFNPPSGSPLSGPNQACETLLRVGSAVALEARQLVAHTAGYRTSAGVACNKLLAKLVSGLHKPDDQTVMLPVAAAAFVAGLPVMSLPGVGFKMTQQLRGMAVTTVQELRSFSEVELVREFGATSGHMLAQLALGKDDSAVVASGAPKAITCEDSFKSCSSFDAVATVVNVVAPDLAARVVEEFEENHRWPKTMTVKWRFRASGFKRSGASTPLPPEARPGSSPQHLEACMVSAAMASLRSHMRAPFDLTLINLGVTSFQDYSAPKNLPKITSMFQSRTSNISAPVSPQIPRTDPALQCTTHEDVNGASDAGQGPQKRSRVSGDVAQERDGKKLCAARRDYKSAARTNVLSKRAERALMDTQAGVLTAANYNTAAASATLHGSVGHAGSVSGKSGVGGAMCAAEVATGMHAGREEDELLLKEHQDGFYREHYTTTPSDGQPPLCQVATPPEPTLTQQPTHTSMHTNNPTPSCTLTAASFPSAPGGMSPHPAATASNACGDAAAAASQYDEYVLNGEYDHVVAPQVAGNCTPASWGSDTYSPPKMFDFSGLPGVLAYDAVEEEGAQTDTTASPLPSQRMNEHMHEHHAPSSQQYPAPEILSSVADAAEHVADATTPEAHVCSVREPSVLKASVAATAAVKMDKMGSQAEHEDFVGTPPNDRIDGCGRDSNDGRGSKSMNSCCKRIVMRLPSLKNARTAMQRRSATAPPPPPANIDGVHSESVSKGDGTSSHVGVSVVVGVGVGVGVGTPPAGSGAHGAVGDVAGIQPEPGVARSVEFSEDKASDLGVGPSGTRGSVGDPWEESVATGVHPTTSIDGSPCMPPLAEIVVGAGAGGGLEWKSCGVDGVCHAVGLNVAIAAPETQFMVERGSPLEQVGLEPSAAVQAASHGEVLQLPQPQSKPQDMQECSLALQRSQSLQPKPAQQGRSGKVILLLQLDSFFCQVEVHDSPTLAGCPLAIQSSPGSPLLATSSEAQACGLHPTAGPVNQDEVTACCPGLVLRTPRHDRCAKESKRLHAELQNALEASPHSSSDTKEASVPRIFQAPGLGAGCSVEVSDCGSFYFDVTAACMHASSAAAHQGDEPATLDNALDTPVIMKEGQEPPDILLQNCKLAGQADAARLRSTVKTARKADGIENPGCTIQTLVAPSWSEVTSDLREGCKIALRLQQYMLRTHEYHASVGVSRTRLVSRLLAPINSPKRLTVLPSCHLHAFMACVPLRVIPALGSKTGAEVQQTLGVETVGEIAKFSEEELAGKFGAARARMLVALSEGGCDGGVQEAGLQVGCKSVGVERSYQMAERPESVAAAVRPLAQGLMGRLAHCASTQKRLPTMLALEWRQGIEATKFKTIPVPTRVCARLRPLLLTDDVTDDANVATGDNPGGSQATASRSSAGRSFSQEAVEPPQLQAEGICGLREQARSCEKAEQSASDMHASGIEAVVAAVSSQIGAAVQLARSIARISICAKFDDSTSATPDISQQRMYTFLASPTHPKRSPEKTPTKSPSQSSKLRAFFQSRSQQSPSKQSASGTAQQSTPLKSFSLSQQQDSPCKASTTPPQPAPKNTDNHNCSPTTAQNPTSPQPLPNITPSTLSSPLKSCSQSLTAKLAAQLLPQASNTSLANNNAPEFDQPKQVNSVGARCNAGSKSMTYLQDFAVSAQHSTPTKVLRSPLLKPPHETTAQPPCMHGAVVPTSEGTPPVTDKGAHCSHAECAKHEPQRAHHAQHVDAGEQKLQIGGLHACGATADALHEHDGGPAPTRRELPHACAAQPASADVGADRGFRDPGKPFRANRKVSTELEPHAAAAKQCTAVLQEGPNVPEASEGAHALNKGFLIAPSESADGSAAHTHGGSDVNCRGHVDSAEPGTAIVNDTAVQPQEPPCICKHRLSQNVLEVEDDDRVQTVVAEGSSKPQVKLTSQQKVLEDAVRGAHAQRLSGLKGATQQGLLNLDERLALRMQQEELARAAPCAKAAATGTAPSPSRKSLKASSSAASAMKKQAPKSRPSTGNMKQLESFFGAPSRSKKFDGLCLSSMTYHGHSPEPPRSILSELLVPGLWHTD